MNWDPGPCRPSKGQEDSILNSCMNLVLKMWKHVWIKLYNNVLNSIKCERSAYQTVVYLIAKIRNFKVLDVARGDILAQKNYSSQFAE